VPKQRFDYLRDVFRNKATGESKDKAYNTGVAARDAASRDFTRSLNKYQPAVNPAKTALRKEVAAQRPNQKAMDTAMRKESRRTGYRGSTMASMHHMAEHPDGRNPAEAKLLEQLGELKPSTKAAGLAGAMRVDNGSRSGVANDQGASADSEQKGFSRWARALGGSLGDSVHRSPSATIPNFVNSLSPSDQAKIRIMSNRQDQAGAGGHHRRLRSPEVPIGMPLNGSEESRLVGGKPAGVKGGGHFMTETASSKTKRLVPGSAAHPDRDSVDHELERRRHSSFGVTKRSFQTGNDPKGLANFWGQTVEADSETALSAPRLNLFGRYCPLPFLSLSQTSLLLSLSLPALN
jgi:hypothetical protein